MLTTVLKIRRVSGGEQQERSEIFIRIRIPACPPHLAD